MLETEVTRKIVFDGTNWQVHIHNKPVGPHCNEKEASSHLAWMNNGALQDMMNVLCDIIEKAFAEREKENNG